MNYLRWTEIASCFNQSQTFFKKLDLKEKEWGWSNIMGIEVVGVNYTLHVTCN